MTDAHERKEGRSSSRSPSAGPPRPLTRGSDAPAAAGQVPDSGKPTSVRDLATPGASRGASPDVSSDLREATVDVDGITWTVRVQGRSGGTSTVSAPLLLLGFWKAESATSPPDREALVVGRALTDMSEGEFESALAQSRVPADPDRRPGFFAEISECHRS